MSPLQATTYTPFSFTGVGKARGAMQAGAGGQSRSVGGPGSTTAASGGGGYYSQQSTTTTVSGQPMATGGAYGAAAEKTM